MILLIAIILIYHFDMDWYWYLAALTVWLAPYVLALMD